MGQPLRKRNQRVSHESNDTPLFENENTATESFRARLHNLCQTNQLQESSTPAVAGNVQLQFRGAIDPPSTMLQYSRNHATVRFQNKKSLFDLADAFSAAGVELRSAALNNLGESEQVIQKSIDAYDCEVTNAIVAKEKVDGYVSNPLSSILCEGDSSATATIETHLLNLQRTLQEGGRSLQTLQDQWNECAVAEVEARRSMALSCAENDGKDTMDLDELLHEVNEAEENALKEIDNEEMKYREKIQEATLFMMHSIMDE